MTVRLRRSALYVPGDNLRALEKARTLPADVLILDLEDSVAPEHKLQARTNVLSALRAGFPLHEVAVRINSFSTEWGDADYQALLMAAPGAIVLPKVEEPGEVRSLALGIPLWLSIETPLGVLRAPDLAAQSGAEALIAGTSDLTRALRARPTADRAPLLYSLSAIVTAARAYGLTALDGVPLDLHDPQGLERSCQQGRDLGFDGRTLIHPAQIAAANQAYGVSDAEAAEARDLLAAWETARAEGRSVALHAGRLVEELHAREARDLLALWEAARDRPDPA